MSHTRLTTRFHRPAACTALALGGLLLTGACGTVHAGADAGSAEPAAAPSSVVTPSAVAPSAVAPAPATSAAPAPGARSSRIRTPLALPGTAIGTGGAITGTVSSGILGCLFVRTDAGQLFNVAGGGTAQLRQLLATTPLATPAIGGLDTRGVAGGVAGSAGSPGSLRISAAGTLRAAPSFCGASYTFTVATVRVESLPLR